MVPMAKRKLNRRPFRAFMFSGSTAMLLAIVGCASFGWRARAADEGGRLTNAERIAHVLSRLTFGPRPGDAERVAAVGIDRWIDQQLHPETIRDSAVVVALASLAPWQLTRANDTMSAVARRLASIPMTALMNDSAARAQLLMFGRQLSGLQSDDEFLAGKIICAQMSERQLFEVVVDFWENHFSVYAGKMPSRQALAMWDRDVLRPYALGKFRDLLGAVAHSPAMVYYLDNHLSERGRLNENYARELLELHTLGVDGGYTQHDVIEVARAFTGWTMVRSSDPSVFAFHQERHDEGSKTVLGHVLPAGRGTEDGEDVLDILSRHPSTARHIAFKLARRLVSDDPSPALVERAAATFLRTDGDITEVVRAIVTSREFFSRGAFRAKVKTPFELVVSARRAVDAPPDTSPATARTIAQLGQPLFGWVSPEGWPDRGDAWMNFGEIYKRIKFGVDLADGGLPTAPLERWRDWTKLSSLPLDRQVDGVVSDVLGGAAEPPTRRAMLAVQTRPPTTSVEDRRKDLRELLSIAFASPEFQRR
jgi:uncharacterized protein (DUF1800 family)